MAALGCHEEPLLSKDCKKLPLHTNFWKLSRRSAERVLILGSCLLIALGSVALVLTSERQRNLFVLDEEDDGVGEESSYSPYATTCCSPNDISCCHAAASGAWIPGVEVVDISKKYGYDIRRKFWANHSAPSPPNRYLRKHQAMKIPCSQWEEMVDEDNDLSCSQSLILSINREAVQYLGMFFSPDALKLQMTAIRDEEPADIDDATRDRLMNTFSSDMRESRAGLLQCARRYSEVYYWAHSPDGDTAIDAAEEALAKSLLPPQENEAEAQNETDADENSTTPEVDQKAIALRRRIAAQSQNMAGVSRVPMNVVWIDPIPDVIAWSGRKKAPISLAALPNASAANASSAKPPKPKIALDEEAGGKMFVEPTQDFMLCAGAQLRKTCRMLAGSTAVAPDAAQGLVTAVASSAACADPALLGRDPARPARLCQLCCSIEPSLCGQSGWD